MDDDAPRRPQWPTGAGLRALFAELVETIEAIGNDVAAAPSQPESERSGAPDVVHSEEQGATAETSAAQRASPGPGFQATASSAEDSSVPTLDGIPLDEAEGLDLDVLAVLCPLPDAVAEPGRLPWSPDVAARPVPPVSPPRPAVVPERGHGMTIAIAVGALAALATVVLHTVDWVDTGGPARAVSAPPLTISDLRATSAPDTASAVDAATQTDFPADTRRLVLDATISGAEPGDQLEWRVVLPSSSGGTPAVVSDVVEPISGAAVGHVEHVVSSGPAPFSPGTYQVVVLSGERTLATTTFTIAGPSPETP
jgi:hypothetical protein